MKHCAICNKEVNGAAVVCCPECTEQAALTDLALDAAARLLAAYGAYDGDCPACVIEDTEFDECVDCAVKVGINAEPDDDPGRAQRVACWKRFFLEEATRPRYRVCGCTDKLGCPEGCWWVEPDLCSRCAADLEAACDGIEPTADETILAGSDYEPMMGPDIPD